MRYPKFLIDKLEQNNRKIIGDLVSIVTRYAKSDKTRDQSDDKQNVRGENGTNRMKITRA
jgi:hypothetical protein